MSNKSLFKSLKNPDEVRMEAAPDGEDAFNLTHLSPLKELARGRQVHRDFLSHWFRWGFVANTVFKDYKQDTCNILDVGCAPDWNQLITLHSNGCHPGYYMGIDARDCSSTIPKTSFPVSFEQVNIVERLPPFISTDDEWDLITFLEVIEHMPKDCGIKVLDNLVGVMGEHTVLIMSTPCYNGTMASNHLYEWGYEELKEELEKRFTIVEHYGTFASLRDYTSDMTEEEVKLLSKLKKYFNSALISCMMAPLYPSKSRNCMWVLVKK